MEPTQTRQLETVIWDLETTGFVAPECKILEIGAFLVNDIGEVTKKHWVLDNKVEIPQNIIEITGITPAIIVEEGRDPEECLLEFLKYLTRAKKNVTHNGVKFDIPFLVATVVDVLKYTDEQKKDLEEFLRLTAFDTAARFKADKLGTVQYPDENFGEFAERVMSQKVFGLKFNLGVCCDHYGIDRSNIVQHRALGDVELTHALFNKYFEK